MRSSQPDSWIGPGADLLDNGDIWFWIHGEDYMECRGKMPTKTSEAYFRMLKFEKIGSTLIFSINGVEKCTHEMTLKLAPDVSLFQSAPLRFGGTYDTDNYNLNALLRNIKLVGDT